MITIQATLDENLLLEVDRVIAARHTTRSVFIREALECALSRFHSAALEETHADGYAAHPVQPGEFEVDPATQEWGAP